jgi:hypothetical protein
VDCREAKKPEAILRSDSFSFMKNNCGDDKFVVIELSQRVKLTSLEITMIELYSSRARTIDLYSTLTKPTKTTESPWLLSDWEFFATVKAENKKGDHVRSTLGCRSSATLVTVPSLSDWKKCGVVQFSASLDV